MHKKHCLCCLFILLISLLISSCTNPNKNIPENAIVGYVKNEEGIVPNAVVRVQTSKNESNSDENGYFELLNISANDSVIITAWSEGHFIGWIEAIPSQEPITIQLTQYDTSDNPDYEWLPSEYHPGEGEHQGCAACHSNEGTQDTTLLPVDEWLMDAHSQSASNPRFITMYNGTDISGNQSSATRYANSRDYGKFPLPPDLTKPYYGPGYKLDFPNSDGNCAACHTPAASVNAPYGVNPTTVEGVAAEGIPCDFCHKISNVRLDPASQLPYKNMPGVLSFEFQRPPEGHQVFIGPLDDVAPGEDTYSPLQKESAFCAPCHQSEFWDTTIYNSYGEWLDSPYSDSDSGQTCQDCHMPSGGADHFALLEMGGLLRDPETIPSHKMLGVMDEAFMQDAISITVTASREGERISVQVDIFNDNTGHHIPSDSPLRHMILVVEAFDEHDQRLSQSSGPVVEDYAGIGDPAAGYYAGLPGKVFAKILKELWTDISPSGSYWNPTTIISDNRIPAMQTDSSTYTFSASDQGPISLKVQLFYRRAFIEIMDQKGWQVPDMLIAAEEMVIPEGSKGD